MIRENSKDEQEYKRYFSSLKSSVLTAFYTQPEAVTAISEALKESGITPVHFLEPSAGNGTFADAFRETFPQNKTVCFEKDLLTGKILSHLHPNGRVHVRGFEEIENRSDNQFDVIASNIPFGDTAVFDMSFSKRNDPARRQAAQKVHNYFFIKGVDTLREGGIQAFITSQGVMNSPQNEPIRQWLMNNANLVSEVRLSNNLMSDNAGMEVGCDLIILQKNRNKTSLTAEEQVFVKSQTLSNGINNYFQDFSRVVHTKSSVDKDLYGKPGLVFIHESGVQDMADDLKRMLSADISKSLNRGLYHNNAVNSVQQQPENSGNQITAEEPEEIDAAVEAIRKGNWDEFVAARSYMNGYAKKTEEKPETKPQVQPEAKPQPPEPPVSRQSVMSLYDLFGFSEEERKRLNTKKKGKKKSAPKQRQSVQLNLFSQQPNTKPKEDTPATS